MYAGLRLDYGAKLWAPTSALHAVSAVAEFLVFDITTSTAAVLTYEASHIHSSSANIRSITHSIPVFCGFNTKLVLTIISKSKL